MLKFVARTGLATALTVLSSGMIGASIAHAQSGAGVLVSTCVEPEGMPVNRRHPVRFFRNPFSAAYQNLWRSNKPQHRTVEWEQGRSVVVEPTNEDVAPALGTEVVPAVVADDTVTLPVPQTVEEPMPEQVVAKPARRSLFGRIDSLRPRSRSKSQPRSTKVVYPEVNTTDRVMPPASRPEPRSRSLLSRVFRRSKTPTQPVRMPAMPVEPITEAIPADHAEAAFPDVPSEIKPTSGTESQEPSASLDLGPEPIVPVSANFEHDFDLPEPDSETKGWVPFEPVDPETVDLQAPESTEPEPTP